MPEETTGRERRNYMRRQVEDHIIPETGEVNCTTLAEDCADHFGHQEWLDDSTHELWEEVLTISEEYEELARLGA